MSALEIFSGIAVSRAAERRLSELSDAGRIHHPPRRASFREAGPVGVAYALRRARDGTGDVLAPTYRAAGALRLFGLELDDFFRAHLAGEVAAPRGPHPELHRVDLDKGILAPVVPLGLLVQVVGGLALGFRMRGEDRVAVVCDSDGATSTGAWHEGLVFAAARRCPMVLVVESGAEEGDLRRQTRLRSFTEKAAGYGVGAASVDGGDVLAVVEATASAVGRARAGEGVQMVEIRYSGTDPIETLRRRIVAEGLAAEHDLSAVEHDAEADCNAAAERAAAHAVPDPSERFGGVYSDSDPIIRRTWSAPAQPTPADQGWL
jgi:TPP-dependent pyruvate/acetoin dehydrogenase alpha subunit